VLAGPIGAMLYRAINTLDSMFGHLDEPYREFGWAAARIDDLANYVPARLTAPLVCLASLFFPPREKDSRVGRVKRAPPRESAGEMVGLVSLDPPYTQRRSSALLRPLCALRILARDGRKHASPNSGLTEAAMAGALGVQLGGVNYYDGQPLQRAKIGDPLRPLAMSQIPQANALMWTAAALFLAICLTARAGVVHCYDRAAQRVGVRRVDRDSRVGRVKQAPPLRRWLRLVGLVSLDPPYIPPAKASWAACRHMAKPWVGMLKSEKNHARPALRVVTACHPVARAAA